MAVDKSLKLKKSILMKINNKDNANMDENISFEDYEITKNLI